MISTTILCKEEIPPINVIAKCIAIAIGFPSSRTSEIRSLIIVVLHKRNMYTVCLQMNGAVSKGNKKFISHLTRAQRTPSAAATVQVSHALPAVHFSCLLRGRGASF